MRVRLKRDRLIEALSTSHISQNHWAIKLGFSRGHFSELVNGGHPYPSPKTRIRLIEGLGIPFDEIFEVETEGDEWSHASAARFKSELSDRYMIDAEIGRGGMGQVHLARDVKHGRQVAVKVVSPEIVSGIGAQQFLKEIRVMSRLQHPHVLMLLDSGMAAGYPYYVMPFIGGGSLRALLEREGRLSVERTFALTRGIAAALTTAHEQHLVHCDLKPENILLDGDHPYLADFGVSRAIHAEAREWKSPEIDSSAGTPAYVSPEQAAGEADLDGRTDVYSLGCVIYEMLSGEAPFHGHTAMEIVSKRFLGDAPDVTRVATGVPQMLATALARAMTIQPERRFDSPVQLQSALEEAAKHKHPLREALSIAAVRTRRTAERIVGVTRMRSRRSDRMLTTLWQDLTYALRLLKRRPAQTAVLAGTLALGIGLTAAMFSVVSAVLVRPLPYSEPDRLVAIWEARREGAREIAFAYPNFADLKEQSERFEYVAAYVGGLQAIKGIDRPIRAVSYYVSPDFFRVLGVDPQRGTVRPASELRTSSPVVLIGDGLWRSAFGADPNVIGRSLTVSGRPATVAGVMPPGFAYPRRAELWMPLDPTDLFGPSRTAHNHAAIGRLRPDASIEMARAELSAIASRLAATYPDELSEDFDFAAVSLHGQLAQDSRTTLLLLLAIVGIVLLIVCGNIASILLSQGVARRKEIAIRQAVGASTRRLVRQMLTESIVLGLVGTVGGLLLAWASMQTLNALVPQEFLHSGGVDLDWRVIGFALVLGAITTIVFGAIPAWRATRREPLPALRSDSTEVAVRGRPVKAGALFVIPQYAFSLAALLVAGLVVKSLLELTNVDPGFDPENKVAAFISLPFARPSPYAQPDNVLQFYDEVLREARALTGVRGATLTLSPPLTGAFVVNGGARTEASSPDEWSHYPDWHLVGNGFFSFMDIPLVRGREFDVQDTRESTPVVLLNQILAQRMFGSRDPLGERIQLSSLDNDAEQASRWLTVVGVVADVRHRSLDELPRAAIYAPWFQHLTRGGIDLLVSTNGDERRLVQPVREMVQRLAPDLAVGRVEPLKAFMREEVAGPRFRAGLVGAFSGLALLLAVLGVYGVISHSVAQRQREMAIRIALGAERAHLIRQVTGQGLRFVVAGHLLGTIAALGLSRLLEGLLFNVSVTDQVVFWTVSPILAGVVLLTSYLPARRAARADPIQVLRS